MNITCQMALCFVLGLVSCIAQAAVEVVRADGSAALDHEHLAVGIDEVVGLVGSKESGRLSAESQFARIRSANDLDVYLRGYKSTPFDALKKRSLELFIESLVFTKSGLASYRYKEIEDELTPRQAYAILELFGAQGTVGSLGFAHGDPEELRVASRLGPIINEDHKGYRCVPPATCITAFESICVGQNCGMTP